MRLDLEVDMDGVLFGFVEGLLRDLRRRTGRDVSFASWKQYKIENQFDPATAGLLTAIFHEPGFFATLEPCPGALGMIDALLAAGHTIGVCSQPILRTFGSVVSVDPSAAGDKIGALVRHFPDLAAEVSLTRRKWKVSADALIDDSPDNIFKWCRQHPRGLGVLIAQPWNEDFGASEGVVFPNGMNVIRCEHRDVAPRIAAWTQEPMSVNQATCQNTPIRSGD